MFDFCLGDEEPQRGADQVSGRKGLAHLGLRRLQISLDIRGELMIRIYVPCSIWLGFKDTSFWLPLLFVGVVCRRVLIQLVQIHEGAGRQQFEQGVW